MSALEKVRDLAARAHEREIDKRKHHDWMIARPGCEFFLHHFQPAQTFEWVSERYHGCRIREGRK